VQPKLLASFRRKKTTIGLDIGSGLIKVAVIDHAKGSPELVRVAITPLSSDAIVEGEVMDSGIVADAIRDAMAQAGVESGNVVTAVGGREVIIKRIQTERVKEQQARELMRWEAEQHVPDVESVEMDFQILDTESHADEMSVLLVAAKKEVVDARIRLLNEAGLTPTIVDVDAFALHNAFEANYPDAMTGVVVLVNIGHETTTINVVDDGVPVMTRDLPIGTRRFREDLQREHGLTAADSEALIRGYDRAPQLDSVLERRGQEIAAGVERTAGFLTQTKRGAELRAVYTCGGGARSPGINEILGRFLRVPIELGNPLATLQIRDGALESLITDEVAPLLMLPIGLALRQ
jgi:type IV pilus assembly protein PilM